MADDLSTTVMGKHGHGNPSGGGARTYSKDTWEPGDGEAVFAAENALVNQRMIQLSFYHVATKKCVFFNGMITGFSDNFSSTWNKEIVYGRMDPMMTFQNTERNMSLSWVVPSVSQDHAKMNLHKFEHLSSLLYPTYKQKNASMGTSASERKPMQINTMNAAPLIKVKFTNLIHGVASGAPNSRSAKEGGLLCAIAGFNFNPNLDVGFYNPEPGIIYPKEYSVDCQMTVLHEHSLGWTKSDSGGFRWLSGKDRFPYGVDKLTGGISVCSGKASAATRPTRNASKTNDNITKRLQSQVLNRRN